MKRIIAGPNSITEALKASSRSIEVLYIASGLHPKVSGQIEALASKHNVPFEKVPKKQLDMLSKGLNHQGMVAITGAYSFVDLPTLLSRAEQKTDPVIIVLDQIQDPGNLGAIVRSAHSLGAAGLIITKDRSATMTSAAVRSSAGASELTAIAKVTNLARCIDQLKDSGYRVYGAAGEAQTLLHQVDWNGKIALVLGNESKGLRQLTRKYCDDLFAIPMASGFESLNVSAAAAISIYEVCRCRNQ